MPGDRLNRLDSWRAIACLGVLWIHCWHINSSVPIIIFGLNIAKLLSVFGNGVDFFYVISGFCMYYFYLNKLNGNSFDSYKHFILSRWYRIVPAYYFAIIIYVIIAKLSFSNVNVLTLLTANFLFVQNFSKEFEVSSHFWSIAVEWQFYLFFPFIVYSHLYGNKFVKYIVILTLIVSSLGVYLLSIDYDNDLHLPVRFVEFSSGILMAYYFKSKGNVSKRILLKSIIGILVLFIGRFLNTDGVLNYWSSSYAYAIIKIVGYALMSGGFSILLYHSISNSEKLFSFLDWHPLVFIGRISYSFYLWHGVVFYSVWIYIGKYLQMDLLYSFLLQFLISIIITIPISFLSYRFIELRFKYQWKSKG